MKKNVDKFLHCSLDDRRGKSIRHCPRSVFIYDSIHHTRTLQLAQNNEDSCHGIATSWTHVEAERNVGTWELDRLDSGWKMPKRLITVAEFGQHILRSRTFLFMTANLCQYIFYFSVTE